MKRKILNAQFRKLERLVVFNRASAAAQDGWIHIVPKGELPNTAAGIVQVLDDAALDSILANIEKDKNRKGDDWPGIYAGREHFIYDADKDSEALAWFKEFEKRDNGIWAKDDGLTDIGDEAIRNRRYKFTSFVADPSDLQKTRGTTDDLPHYRVMAIETVGFTNQANGKELLTPITNREQIMKIKNGDVAGHEFHGNQYKEAGAAADKMTGEADKAEKKANRTGNLEDRHQAIKAHANAEMAHRQAAREAANNGDRLAGREHNYQANKHQAAREGQLKHFGVMNRALPPGRKCPDCGAKLKKQSDGSHACENSDCDNDDNFSGSGETDEETTKTKNRNRMKKIATALDLTEEASEDAILSAVTKLKNRVTELEPLGAENLKLKKSLTEVDGAAVDALLSAHNVKDEKVLNRLKPIITGLPVGERASALIDFGFKPGETKPAARVLNRGGGAAAVADSGVTEGDEQAITEKITNRANELKGKGLKFDAAWNQARREIAAKK